MKTNTIFHPRALLRSLFAIAAVFAAPAVGRAAFMYVSVNNTLTIDQVSSSGVVSLFAVLPLNSFPSGLAFDGSGILYAADSGSDKIFKITSGGVVSLFATLPAGSQPYGLAFDVSGNLYAANNNTDTISKITSGGAVSEFATLPATSRPYGLAFDSSGNLYAADNATNQISMVTSDGLTISTFASGITSPTFIALAPVPEPTSAALLLSGGAILALLRRRIPSVLGN